MAMALSTVKQSSHSPPAVMTRETDTLIRRLLSALEPAAGHYSRKAIAASALPDTDERLALVARRDELADAFTPSDADEVKRSVAALRANLPAPPGSDASSRMILSACVSVLQPFPIWAVNEVCRRYLDGTLSSGGYAPSAPEMATACRSVVAKFQEERGHIEAILTAEVLPPPGDPALTAEAEAAIREAAVDHWQKNVRPQMRPAESAKPKETAEEALERLKALPLPGLSETAMAKIKGKAA